MKPTQSTKINAPFVAGYITRKGKIKKKNGYLNLQGQFKKKRLFTTYIYGEDFYFVDRFHCSALHGNQGATCREAHTNFAADSACLTADVWNEVQGVQPMRKRDLQRRSGATFLRDYRALPR
jgi:hypothetical protein